MPKIPDIDDDHILDLLTAEQLLDEVRDTPHMHVADAIAIGIAAKQAGIDMQDMVSVHLKRRT